MKGKCIFSITIVVTLAALSVAALMCSMSEIPENKIPEHNMMSEVENIVDPEDMIESNKGIIGRFSAFLKARGKPYGTMIILISLFSIGDMIYRQTRNDSMFRVFAGIVYTLAVSFAFGKWGIYMAGIERGYEAVGGEYCFIPIVFWGAEIAVDYLFDTMENLKHEQACKKGGS